MSELLGIVVVLGALFMLVVSAFAAGYEHARHMYIAAERKKQDEL